MNGAHRNFYYCWDCSEKWPLRLESLLVAQEEGEQKGELGERDRGKR
jgi:hypothetical protein